MQRGNLFEQCQAPAEGERFETLLTHQGLLIERIISSPKIASTEYIQPQDEWVLLVQGEATMDVAGVEVTLSSGDYLFLPSKTPHTVRSVSDGALWLAIHLSAAPA